MLSEFFEELVPLFNGIIEHRLISRNIEVAVLPQVFHTPLYTSQTVEKMLPSRLTLRLIYFGGNKTFSPMLESTLQESPLDPGAELVVIRIPTVLTPAVCATSLAGFLEMAVLATSRLRVHHTSVQMVPSIGFEPMASPMSREHATAAPTGPGAERET